MTYYGLQAPLNDVIMGQPTPNEYLKAETDNIKPGLLIKKGSDQSLITICDAEGQPGGWAGYGAGATFKPVDRDTPYSINDMVPVHNGTGFFVVAILAEDQQVNKNEPLVPADNGEVQAVPVEEGEGENNSGVNFHVGYASHDADSTGNAIRILVRSII